MSKRVGVYVECDRCQQDFETWADTHYECRPDTFTVRVYAVNDQERVIDLCADCREEVLGNLGRPVNDEPL